MQACHDISQANKYSLKYIRKNSLNRFGNAMRIFIFQRHRKVMLKYDIVMMKYETFLTRIQPARLIFQACCQGRNCEKVYINKNLYITWILVSNEVRSPFSLFCLLFCQKAKKRNYVVLTCTYIKWKDLYPSWRGVKFEKNTFAACAASVLEREIHT